MHPDIPEEQAYFDRALQLRERMEADLGRAARNPADPKTATELRRRVGALGVVDPGAAVAFGRIDAGGNRWYIGKSAVWDEDNELVVVNWQAPIAAPFYTATPDAPEGLDARRIYRCERNRVLDIEETVFHGLERAVRNGVKPAAAAGPVRRLRAGPGRSSAPAPPSGPAPAPAPGGFGTGADDPGPAPVAEPPVDPGPVHREDGPSRPHGGGRSGPAAVSDALLAALERERSGELTEIVATIQAAQYDIITRDIEQLLVVQGGPGTGKTVVGLHRVSWMLHQRRERWQSRDILVVGPNPAFVRYISSVLPSLGDEAVVQLAVTALGPQVTPGRVDPVALRKLKGDRRMLRLLLRAVRNRQKPQRGPIDLAVAGRTVRLDGDRIAAYARRLAGQPHNEAGRALRSFVMGEIQTFFSRRGLRGLAAIEDMAQSEATREIDAYLDRIWPVMSPQGFLVDLFSTPRRLESAGVGLFTAEELAMLSIPPDSQAADWTWAVDDVPLLDLADALLNGTPATFEHIVVDEAQDLSPMQFESIRRRSRTGWMTVLGDVAQATSPWAPGSWEEAALHLRRDRVPTEIAELSLGYRLPEEVHDVAMRLLPEIAPGLRAPQAMRTSGHAVKVVPAHAQGLAGEVVDAARQAAETGLVAVIVAQRARAGVTQAMDAAGLAWSDELHAGETSVVVVAADEAKGLEFDAVVVVEPAQIVDESPHGLRALFVALTRTTGRLTMVHAEPLPDVLGIDSPVPPPPPPPEPPVAAASPVVSEPPSPPQARERLDEADALAPAPWSRQPVSEAQAPATPPQGVPASGYEGRHGLRSGGSSNGSTPTNGHLPPAGGMSDSLAALDQAMARAIAGRLAETLARYVTPALVPLVLEEMRHRLDERDEVQVVDVRNPDSRVDRG